MKTVTVFGGRIAPKKDLEDAYCLGRKIGKRGYMLKNGGYSGIMEHSAAGCVKESGEVIGVCVKGNFNGRAVPNKYSTMQIFAENLDERVKELLRTDMVVVFPGRLGTLDELIRAWANKATDSNFPIYVYGEKNKALLEFLRENNYIKEEDFSLIKYVDHIEEIDLRSSAF